MLSAAASFTMQELGGISLTRDFTYAKGYSASVQGCHLSGQWWQ
jgi:hypothetical protein